MTTVRRSTDRAGVWIPCDYCDCAAERAVSKGDPAERRVFCPKHVAEAYEGLPSRRRQNDWIRSCPKREYVKAMRRQNVKRGLLSPQKHASLCRRSPDE